MFYALLSLSLCLIMEIPFASKQTDLWPIIAVVGFIGLAIWQGEFFSFLPLIFYSAFALWGGLSFGLLVLLVWDLDLGRVLLSGLALYLAYQYRYYTQARIKNIAYSDKLKEDMISLEKYNSQLLENRKKSQEIARLEERNKIASQLHDYLGHTISSSILQVEALKLTEADGDKKERLQLLQDTLSNGMMDIRRQLHGMYQNSFSLQGKIEDLIKASPEIKITFQSQISQAISFEKKGDIYTIIRQALANTMKHSDATRFEIFLKDQAKNQILIIKDNGTKEVKTIKPNMGLAGMADIVQKYGGKLNYFYKRGFHIHIVLSDQDRPGESI